MKKLGLIGFFVFASVGFAQAETTCNELVCQGHAEKLVTSIVVSQQDTLLRIHAAERSQLSCSLQDGEFARLHDKSKTGAVQRNLLTMAVAGQFDVVITFTDSERDCTVASVELITP